MKSNTTNLPLETLSESGQPPVSRLTDAAQAREVVKSLIDEASERNMTDAQVAGLFDGNPPFRRSELLRQGQGHRANFNSRIAESFLDSALAQPWDVVSTPAVYCQVTCDYGPPEVKDECSKIVTEEFDRMNRRDRDLNYMFMLSQRNMIQFRMGPVMWMDKLTFRAKPIPQQNLLVLQETKSNVDDWSLAVVRVSHSVSELYGYIRNAKSAEKAGWNVGVARNAIINAMPEAQHRNAQEDWMYQEQRLRNNDIIMSALGESIPVAWILWKEFDGKISQAAIAEGDEDIDQWLFRDVGRYENWRQVLCPFYFDIGDGTHNSIKGLGIKCYGILATYDRFQCHLVDAGFFGSSLHFQANSANDMENLAVITMGPYVWHPPGGTYLPTAQLGTQLDGPMAVKQDLLATVTNNIAQYRSQLSRAQAGVKGNPPTAKQVEFEAANQGVIGRAQLNRYFEQLDDFWSERYRRAANPANPDPLAVEFRKRCQDRGVPPQALRKVDSVKASRTVGFGSVAARQESLNQLLGMVGLFSETGRQNTIEDVVSNLVGYAQMPRYATPQGKANLLELEQEAEALQSVAAMRVSVQIPVTPKQNPMIYAMTYIAKAKEAVQGLQQGAQPAAVYDFLTLILPAIAQHLQRMSGDQSRAGALQGLQQEFGQLQQVYGQLKGQLEQSMQAQMRQQQQQQQQAQQAQGDMALKAQVAQGDMALKAAKTQQAMNLKDQQTRQKMQIADRTAAAKIRLQRKTTQ